MTETTSEGVECPICGEGFDPTAAGGWCTNPECGEWQYLGEEVPEPTDEPAEIDEAVDPATAEDSVDADGEAASGGDDADGESAEDDELTLEFGKAPGDESTGADTGTEATADEEPDAADAGTEPDLDDGADLSDPGGEAAESSEPDGDVAPEEADADATACPECGAEVEAGASFCPVCGTDLTDDDPLEACPACGADVDPDDTFCAACGEDLEAARAGGASSAAPDRLALGVRGEEVLVAPDQTVGREIRRIVTETGGDEDDAVRIHREHVRFVRDDGRFYVVDLGDNPTELNGSRLAKGDREPVEPGDELALSDVVTLSVERP